MSDSSRNERVAAHIASIASRTEDDARVLADALRARSWPGGDDRSEPTALAWVRRWRPRGAAPLPLRCGCADGRCLVCN